jgi:hypothetical protein
MTPTGRPRYLIRSSLYYYSLFEPDSIRRPGEIRSRGVGMIYFTFSTSLSTPAVTRSSTSAVQPYAGSP